MLVLLTLVSSTIAYKSEWPLQSDDGGHMEAAEILGPETWKSVE